MKTLVTGGCGFIGSHLVDRLITEGHEVYVFDDYSGGDNENSSAFYHVVDCRNAEYVDEVMSWIKPEIVYHLAANPAENKAQFSPIDITTRGYDAFVKVLTASIKHGVRRFVFTSSIAAYGSIEPPFYEEDICEPEDLYGIGKLAAEQTLQVMSKVHGIEYQILRPHNVYGPRQSAKDPYRNVITIWMNSLLKGEPYVIYGDGETLRCYSYVDDVVDGIYRASVSKKPNQIYNIGSGKEYSLKELSDILQEVTGHAIPPVFLPSRPQEVKIAIANHDKAWEELDTYAKVNLKEGLTRMWKDAKKRGYIEPTYTEIELPSEKMPQNWRAE